MYPKVVLGPCSCDNIVPQKENSINILKITVKYVLQRELYFNFFTANNITLKNNVDYVQLKKELGRHFT